MTRSPALATETPDVDVALKAKHRALWALGDYGGVATLLIPTLGATLAQACHVGPGQHVLDVAAGTGNVAIPAARAGAEVVAADLTPELLREGEALAQQSLTPEQRDRLTWREADAEALPFVEDSFDTVLSCVGVMFAPHHQLSADEILRVCRPGGTIGLLSWTPAGFLGQLLATIKPYAPPPPAGTQPPSLWGDEQHVRGLFGEHITQVEVSTDSVTVDAFVDGAAFRDYFKSAYGPTIAAYRGLAQDPEGTTALDADLAALADQHLQAGQMEWEYLLVVAQRH